MAPRRISLGWDCFASKWYLFLAFHIGHDTIAHSSSSGPVSLATICLARRRKFGATAPHFCSLPLTSAHTFRARGHSHSAWVTVSSTWPQTVQSRSIGIFLQNRLARVGSISEQALHTKFRTFGGNPSFHTLFQSFLSSQASECSTTSALFKRRATYMLTWPRTLVFYSPSTEAYLLTVGCQA